MNTRVLREGMPEQILARDIAAAKQYNTDAVRRHAELVARVTKEIQTFKQVAKKLASAKIQELRTTPYAGEKADLLNYAEKITPEHLQMKRSDAIEYAKLAFTALNVEVTLLGNAPVTEPEAAVLADFCVAQSPELWPYDIEGNSLFCAWRILTFEGALRAAPAGPEQQLPLPPAPKLRDVPRDPYEGIEEELERECPFPVNAEDEPWMRKQGTSASGERETWMHRNRTAKILERDKQELREGAARELSPLVQSTMQELSTASGLKIPQSVISETLECFDTARPRLLLSRENLRRCFVKRFFKQIATPENVFTADEIREWHQDNFQGTAEEFAAYFGLGNPGMGTADAPTFSRQRG